MKMTGNTILITGGGTGIGRGLAEALHALGNQVVIAGRRRPVLDETTAANPGMGSRALDLEEAGSLQPFAQQMAEEYPRLNVLIHNAGIMKAEDLKHPQEGVKIAESTIAVNLLGPIRLTAALLPLLQRQPRSTIMTVSSGLAFVPMALTPTYCATKAAIHSYTLSLRYQMKATTTEVLELIPPYVATHLMERNATDPRAMPVAAFVAEVMEILKTQPTVTEICVEKVKRLRFAVEAGRFNSTFQGMNDAMTDDH